jgi:hypothetical protein
MQYHNDWIIRVTWGPDLVNKPISISISMLPMEKSVTFTGACANAIIPEG